MHIVRQDINIFPEEKHLLLPTKLHTYELSSMIQPDMDRPGFLDKLSRIQIDIVACYIAIWIARVKIRV